MAGNPIALVCAADMPLTPVVAPNLAPVIDVPVAVNVANTGVTFTVSDPDSPALTLVTAVNGNDMVSNGAATEVLAVIQAIPLSTTLPVTDVIASVVLAEFVQGSVMNDVVQTSASMNDTIVLALPVMIW